MNKMDIEMEVYLRQFIESKIKQTQEPVTVAPSDISVKRNLAEFQSRVQVTFLEFQMIQQQNPSAVDFVRSAIIHLQKLRKDAQKKYGYEIFKQLFEKLTLPNLAPNIQAATQQAVDFIDKKIDYFCSYTRKGLPDINSSYKEIIYDALTIKPETHPKEWKEINFVAKILVRYLNNHGFNNYFFDLDKMVNGEEIEDTVLGYCDKATVLLLLAQQETFRDRLNETNWCYQEYDRYRNTHDKKHFLVFRTENLVRPEDAGDSILTWFDHIAGEKGVYGFTIESNGNIAKLKLDINNTAKQIREIKEKVFTELVFSIV